jgi:hypothetical protein
MLPPIQALLNPNPYRLPLESYSLSKALAATPLPTEGPLATKGPPHPQSSTPQTPALHKLHEDPCLVNTTQGVQSILQAEVSWSGNSGTRISYSHVAKKGLLWDSTNQVPH